MHVISTSLKLNEYVLVREIYSYCYFNFTHADENFSPNDFNGKPTCLGLFYAKRFGNYIHCIFVFTFLYSCFLRVFFFLDTRTQLNVIKYFYLIEIICMRYKFILWDFLRVQDLFLLIGAFRSGHVSFTLYLLCETRRSPLCSMW